MKHALLALLIVASALPASAHAKGPAAASIEGPGSGGGITFSGSSLYVGSPLGNLTEQAGFFPAAFGQQPDPMLEGRPNGDLGPKYTIGYSFGGGSNEKIRQDVYPFAKPSPVTYMEPGQRIWDGETRGGWFQADAALKQTLVSAGLPNAPLAPSSGSSGFPTTLVTLPTVALLLLTATAVVVRRRARPAAA